ncbi:MAG: urease accessory UreF family protein [Pseudomonadota bacterium]
MSSSHANLIKLMTWLSPAFPIGGFAWSAGLEAACADKTITNAEDIKEWLSLSLHHGTLRTDAVLLSLARQRPEELETINATALALAGSRTRYEETTALGSAFMRAAEPWTHAVDHRPKTIAYPVAVGHVAANHAIDQTATLTAFLQSAVSAQLQAGLRLFSFGQAAAVGLQQALEADIVQAAKVATDSTLDHLGTAAPLMDITAIAQETLPTRLFQS